MNSLLRRHGPAWVIIMAFVLVAGNKLDGNGVFVLLRQAAIIGTGALGVSIIALCDGFLLSSGSQIALTGLMLALLVSLGMPVWLGVLATFLAAGALGWAVGYFTHSQQLPILVVSFGLEMILLGVGSVVGIQVGNYPLPQLQWLAGRGDWSVLLPVLLFGLLVAVLTVMDHFTTWGRVLHGVGEDFVAAQATGLPALRIKLASYAVGFLLINLCGLLMVSRILIPSNFVQLGKSYDIVCILCVAGVGLRRGEGGFAAILPASVALILIDTVINLYNIAFLNGNLVKGMLLIGVLVYEAFRANQKEYVEKSKKGASFFINS